MSKMQVPTNKTVAIVHFNHPIPEFARTIYYQVTIDPEKVSISGDFIRFGEADGDEIIGWQTIDSLDIDEIMAEVDQNGVFNPPPRAL